ncbi:Leucine rich repeat proteins some proteins containing F-box protein [Dioscorea alata]|uniref:Leucine rich repeat proteins some proteins containing F-box protein n=4 Tax=Dioscorea alata TaxID=55571 RepID=A0ACB7U326_DIOAL|nr:Leucine rich repeat proteins some proteins containing F-box protein [Dioscorea alata]KAH7654675.1 Leucine rich repeat proteins some proteins containing F-box protein [Dioscorea alata]KAH7654676.1 Leucine rich repeat proteins some proteins containing F-box protein [Dioscorea alata]KAH7654677.1 Leucine rich repeat proteins some proteins containing F-box protein [Dioscorea alata]
MREERSSSEIMSGDDDDDDDDHGHSMDLTAGDKPCVALPSDLPPPFSDQVIENVLENVLQFLTTRHDRNAASLVCRSWYHAEARTRRELFIGNCYAVDPARAVARFPGIRAVALKGKPRFADFGLLPQGWGGRFTPWAKAFCSSYSSVEKLHLKRMTVVDQDLFVISRYLPSFRELTLFCCDGFGTGGLAYVAENCRRLRVLDLIENDMEDDEDDDDVDWISKFPETKTYLESLVFDCVRCPVNFEALEALVARSPALLRLRVNQHVSLGQLQRLMVRAPQLTHLGTGSFRFAQAANEQVVDLNPAFVTASRSLVCLSGFRGLAPEYLPAILPACPNLTSLNFSYAEITTEQLRPIIVHCHNLQNFWVLDTVGDEGLQLVAATCKDLRELRVFPFYAREDSEGSVSDVGLQAISEGCPKLRSILYFCQRMTNAAVVSMSKNCPELVVFRLCIMDRHRPDHRTREAMDDGFGAIVMNCKKLTRLAVSGLLTDKAFRYIGKYGKSVRTLSVAFAGDSDLGLRYVLEGCPKLQKLEIRDSPFGDLGLFSGIQHYYNMRFLWMSACKLSLRGCQDVARTLPHLVVEVIRERPDEDVQNVERLYLYRSLAGPRTDAPPFVEIL